MLALHQIFLQAEKSMHYSTFSNTQTHTKYHIYMGNKTEGEPWWYIYLCISEGMKTRNSVQVQRTIRLVLHIAILHAF